MSKRLSTALKNKARGWASYLTRLAKSFAPAHVRPAISSHVEQKGDDTFIIRVKADRKIAPDARAQELGSGLRARRGPKRKYPIKGNPFLVFHWDVALNNPDAFKAVMLPEPDMRVVFPQVMHPGIKATNNNKGYIAPAMIELRKKAKAELNKDSREAILGDLRESFGRKVK